MRGSSAAVNVTPPFRAEEPSLGIEDKGEERLFGNCKDASVTLRGFRTTTSGTAAGRLCSEAAAGSCCLLVAALVVDVAAAGLFIAYMGFTIG